MKIIYWYEIIDILLNQSFFYFNYIFQMWLHLFNSFYIYKTIRLSNCLLFLSYICIIIFNSRIINWVELDKL